MRLLFALVLLIAAACVPVSAAVFELWFEEPQEQLQPRRPMSTQGPGREAPADAAPAVAIEIEWGGDNRTLVVVEPGSQLVRTAWCPSVWTRPRILRATPSSWPGPA
jgi:hypothetical protein